MTSEANLETTTMLNNGSEVTNHSALGGNSSTIEGTDDPCSAAVGEDPCVPVPNHHTGSPERIQLLETQLAAEREENAALQLSTAMPTKASESSMSTRSKSDSHAYHAPEGRKLAPARPRLSDMWDIQHGVPAGAHGRIPTRKAPPPHLDERKERQRFRAAVQAAKQGILLETLDEFRARVQP